MEQETSVARIPMRDGVNLAADVYLPARKEGERVPAVITRTPYFRNWTAIQRRAQSFCEAGFAFVAVDCRGRGDSDGVFFPYRDDGEDGYDTIEWVGSQPWCTGNVGTIGGSYSGRIQWLAALQKPPSLKAMIISVTPSDPFVEWPTGIPSPFHLCWLYMTWGKDMQSVDHIPWNDIYSHLPLVDASSLITDKDVKMWKVEMEHNEGRDDWWRKICYQHRFKEIDIPIFHISGWYDDELVGTPLNFIGMKREGPVTARDKQKLLVGPWPHSVNSSTRFGPLDFGEDSVIQIEKPYFKWFGKFLRGEENDILDNPVEVFLMGTNKWVKAKDFPLPGTDNQKWYFHSTQGAVTSKGDGSLSTSLPTEKERATDEYDYNPMDPFPYISEPTSAQIGGPDDYATLEEQRADNLISLLNS